MNLENVLDMSTKLSEIIKNDKYINIPEEISKISNEKKLTIENIYDYIIRNFSSAPFAILDMEEKQKKLLDEIKENKNDDELLKSYNYWNVILTHFKYIFNHFLNIINNPDLVQKIKMEEELEKKKRARVLDIRAKFPKVELPEEEMSSKEEKIKQRVGLSKESRKYLMTKKQMDKLIEKEKERKKEDESQDFTVDQLSLIDKITEDLGSKLQID
jgi:hypothetical protein